MRTSSSCGDSLEHLKMEFLFAVRFTVWLLSYCTNLMLILCNSNITPFTWARNAISLGWSTENDKSFVKPRLTIGGEGARSVTLPFGKDALVCIVEKLGKGNFSWASKSWAFVNKIWQSPGTESFLSVILCWKKMNKKVSVCKTSFRDSD